MKQIVDKLNKIAKKINENVELSDRDLIIDSLDSITKAYGGTPNDSTLIVDKLDDIYNNIGSGGGGGDTYTETFEVSKDTTAAAVEDSGMYSVDLTPGDDFYVNPSFDITINVNNTDINMLFNNGYWEDNADNPAYTLYLGNTPVLLVPAAGDYTVKSISVTVTGNSLVNCKTTENRQLAFYFTDNDDALYYFDNTNIDVGVNIPIKSIVATN